MQVTDRVGDFLSKSVQADQFDFTIAAGNCDGVPHAANVSTTHTDKDLIIYIVPRTSADLIGRNSAGEVCAGGFDSSNINRPVSGFIWINVEE